MSIAYRALAPVAALLLFPAEAGAQSLADPLRFFEGRTETQGTVKVVMKKSVAMNSSGRGRIERDGTLVLVQQVNEDGKPVKERHWRIRPISRGRFAGTMSEASGPVTIDQVGTGYRFRFPMKGNLTVEQWLSPLAGGTAALSRMTVRKMGIKVASGESIIRKLPVS